MALRIEGTQVITATATAQDVDIGYRTFIIKNTGSGTVYFREKDGAAAASTNSFTLGAGEIFPEILTAEKLSISASASCAVCILYGTEA